MRASRLAIASLLFGWSLVACRPALGEEASWTFVSIPDFLNGDIDDPQPGWDDALDFTLEALKREEPDFVLVAGDMVNGRWWRSERQVDYMADRYYSAWNRRMQRHGLTPCYVAVGDHEVGDNPWMPRGGPFKRMEWNGTWDCAPLEFLPVYERAFVRSFPLPRNGPADKLGLAYYVRHKGVLIVTLDVFDQQLLAEHGQADVTPSQLEWLDKLLAESPADELVIVQAHTPILGPVRRAHSSGMMLKGGAESPLWRLLARRQADLYLCGEVHAVTCTLRDGVQQIAHGSIFGWADSANYLVGRVFADRVELQIKQARFEVGGTFLPQSAANEPKEWVRVSDASRRDGFVPIGSLTIGIGQDSEHARSATGVFAEEYAGEPARDE